MALFAMVSQAADQTTITSQYGPTASRLIDAALQDDAGYARLVTLCDRIGNRLSGSESLLRAVKWSAEEMKKAGLTNVVTPPVMVPHWVRGKESGAIIAPIERPLHFLGLGMSVQHAAGGHYGRCCGGFRFRRTHGPGDESSRQNCSFQRAL